MIVYNKHDADINENEVNTEYKLFVVKMKIQIGKTVTDTLFYYYI